jgi:hypothetical protein
MQNEGSVVQAAHSGRHLQDYYVLPAERILVCCDAKHVAPIQIGSPSLAVVPPQLTSQLQTALIPTALEQFRFDAEKPAISKACGDLIGSD